MKPWGSNESARRLGSDPEARKTFEAIRSHEEEPYGLKKVEPHEWVEGEAPPVHITLGTRSGAYMPIPITGATAEVIYEGVGEGMCPAGVVTILDDGIGPESSLGEYIDSSLQTPNHTNQFAVRGLLEWQPPTLPAGDYTVRLRLSLRNCSAELRELFGGTESVVVPDEAPVKFTIHDNYGGRVPCPKCGGKRGYVHVRRGNCDI